MKQNIKTIKSGHFIKTFSLSSFRINFSIFKTHLRHQFGIKDYTNHLYPKIFENVNNIQALITQWESNMDTTSETLEL